MIVLFALIGLLIGWLINVMSEFLPRFAVTRPVSSNALPLPTIVNLLMRETANQRWPRVHLGVELLTAAFFAWLASRTVLPVNTLFLVVGFVLFLLIAVIDFKYQLILNIVVYPAILLSLVLQVLLLGHDPRTILVGGMLAFTVFYMVAWLKPGQLGGGDVKLAALLGLTFGFPQVLLVLLMGTGAGGAAAVFLLSRRAGLQYRMPYAPFLCLGAITILMYYSLHMTW